MTDQSHIKLTTDLFTATLQREASLYGVALTAEATARLADYYCLVNLWNSRLHLVAPCAPEEFARRHILESLFAMSYLPLKARLIDIGAGAGLPSIPCLIVRSDLHAQLIEASAKKSVFLREALRTLGLSAASHILNHRFEQIEAPLAESLTCRALDAYSKLLPALLNWGSAIPILILFGGPSLAKDLDKLVDYESILLPQSEQRYMFLVKS
ncbi:MAG: RsmG family class I SAM-dependent methyltransferase [Pyrinomonadaceae bacterium]